MLMSGSEKFRQVCNPRFPARAQHPDSQKAEKGILNITEMTGQLQAATSGQLAQSFSDTGSLTVLGIFLNSSWYLFLLSVTSGHGHHPKPIVLPPLALSALLHRVVLGAICIPI